MTRRSLALAAPLLVTALGACKRDATSTADARPVSIRSRIDAVPAKAPAAPEESLASFCDVRPEPPRTFAFPQLAAPAPPRRAGWRWINLWATWCTPCIAEMPLLFDWQRRLGGEGRAVELVLLSLDEDGDAVAEFRASRPEVPAGPRVRDPQGLGPWLVSLGLDGAAAIPINVFVDPEDRIRCVRAGAIADHHFDTVAALLRR